MILKIFTVYDTKAEAYMNPFFLPSTGLAIRSFCDLLEDKNHAFSKHPQDFVLHELGSFDDSRASFDCLSPPKSLGTALEFATQSVS